MSRQVGATDSSRTHGAAAARIAEGAIAWDAAAERWYITDEPTEWGIAEDGGVPEVVPAEEATERILMVADNNVIRDI